MKLFTLCACQFGGTVINGLDQQNMNRNVQEFLNAADGNISPSIGGIMKEEPVFDFSTFLIKSVLTAIPFTGKPISADAHFWFREKEDGASNKTTGIKITVTKGLAVISRIEAQQDAEAKISVDVHMTSPDGTNRPFTITLDAALPTMTAVNEKWTAGPVVLGGATIETQGWSLDCGYAVGKAGHSGLAYPNFSCVDKFEPSFGIQTTDVTALNTYNPGANVLTNGFYLRKMADGSDRVAAATAQHIKLAVSKAFAYTGRASASQGSNAQVDITVKPVLNGATAIITADTAVAMP